MAGIFLPVILFFMMAYIVVRAHEMRQVSNAMTQVAMRLVEPENVAKESVVNVGQAIRREVASMSDGIERALARASELEVMVHNEGVLARTCLHRKRTAHPLPD